ncbi:MAG TPA: hypothetical protein VFO70_07835 [Chitinophagaceae bacterium]|nr:hypothetical protein [Chitinophagaceae bacterium]
MVKGERGLWKMILDTGYLKQVVVLKELILDTGYQTLIPIGYIHRFRKLSSITARQKLRQASPSGIQYPVSSIHLPAS